MSARTDSLLTLAEVCKTPGITLADLAMVSGVSLAAIKQLEQNPPVKHNTWLAWKSRFLEWLPLLGHAFPDLLETKALRSCPREIANEIINELQQAYADWTMDSQSDFGEASLAPSLIIAREKKLFQAAQEYVYRHDWLEAERYAARATRLFPKDDPRWLFYRAYEANCRVYRGAIESAEALINRSLIEHGTALAPLGKQPDPLSEGNAELVSSWSNFYRGQWSRAINGFDNAIKVGHLTGDVELLNTGSHMRERAALEHIVLNICFNSYQGQKRPSPTELTRSIVALEKAQAIVPIDSIEYAFGIWFIGLLLQLSGDLSSGQRLLDRSAHVLKEHGLTVALLTHSELSKIQTTFIRSAWDDATYRQLESKLYDMLFQFEHDQFPYMDALVTMTLVQVRLRRDQYSQLLKERQHTIDLLCLSLLAHPYLQHTLWQIGLSTLREKLLLALGVSERVNYGQSLKDRVVNNDTPFHLLAIWKCDLAFREEALEYLRRVFLGLPWAINPNSRSG